MVRDVVPGQVVAADRQQQQAQVSVIPPAIEEQRAQGQPSGTKALAPPGDQEKSRSGKRQEQQDEGV